MPHGHTCHAAGCTRTIPPAMFMCKAHWYALSATLRKRIWATYRPGQEDDKAPSAAYCDAAIAAVRSLAEPAGIDCTNEVRMYELFKAAALQGVPVLGMGVRVGNGRP